MSYLSAQDSLVVMKTITMQGIKRTHPKTILREMNFKEGDTLSANRLDAIMERNRFNVYNLGLFNDVDFNYVTENGWVYLIILVRERWYIEPVLRATLEERYFSEWYNNLDLDRMVVGGGVNWKNLTGYNDQLYLYVQEGYDREISASFRRPFVFPKSAIDLNVSYSYTEKKEIELWTDYAASLTDPERGQYLFRLPRGRIRFDQSGWVQLTKRFDPLNRLTFSMGYVYYQVHDTVSVLNPLYLTSGTDREYYPKVRLSFSRDYRDWKVFPLKGYRLMATVEQSGLGVLSTTSFLNVSVSFSQFLPLTKKWNFAWSTWHTQILGREVPYFDKVFIGTGNFIRGFEPFVLSGTSAHALQNEIRYALIPRHIIRFPFLRAKNPEKDLLRKFRDFPLAVYLVAFTDIGIVRDNARNNRDAYFKDRGLVGYGVGMNFLTIYDHFLRIELSRNNIYNSGSGYYFNLTGRIAIR